VDELASVTVRHEGALQAADQILAAIESILEGDGPGDWPVIEEQGERPPSWPAPEIRPARIDVVVDFFPTLGAILRIRHA
jgi:hypothetical protein